MLAKDWHRKFNIEEESSANYRPSMGVVVEFNIRGDDGTTVPHYCQADFPYPHVMEFRLLCVQRDVFRDPNMTAMDLYNALPNIKPLVGKEVMS